MAGRWRRLFGLGRGEERPEPQPEEPREGAPEPAPGPPEPGAGEERPARRGGGFFRRLLGRGKREEAAPEEAPPPVEIPPEAAPAEPERPAEEAAPEAEEEAAPEEEAEEAPEEAEAPEPEKEYPSSLSVAIAGTWQISSTVWPGVIRGTLSGGDVRDFIDAIDAGDDETAIMLAAGAYDRDGQGFAAGLNIGASSWGEINIR